MRGTNQCIFQYIEIVDSNSSKLVTSAITHLIEQFCSLLIGVIRGVSHCGVCRVHQIKQHTAKQPWGMPIHRLSNPQPLQRMTTM